MAKFSTIWGDLEVRDENIMKNDDKPDPTLTAKSPEPIVPTRTIVDDEEEEEEVVQPTPKKPTPDSDDDQEEEEVEEEEEEEYDFTQDDVVKAFNMLDEEGVLDISDEDELEQTPKGLADAIAITIRNKVEKEFKSIPPVVKDFYDHIMEGNSPAEFKAGESHIDWSEVSDSDDSLKVMALKILYKKQGMSDEDIHEEIEEITSSNKLDKKGVAAIDVLAKQQLEDADKEAEKRAKEEAAFEKQRETEINELKSTIDSSKEIAGFELDDSKRKAFKDYLFKVDPRTGKTQMQENMASEERRMTIAFLDFVNYNKSDLKKEVTTSLTKTRKKQLSKYTDKNLKNTNTATVKTQNNKSGSIKFPSIFGTQKIEIED